MAKRPDGGIAIRLYNQEENGEWVDWQNEFTANDFAGEIPQIGDMILDPGVAQGENRYDPANRTLYTVVQRIFNPRDLSNYVVLVVEGRVPQGREAIVVSMR